MLLSTRIDVAIPTTMIHIVHFHIWALLAFANDDVLPTVFNNKRVIITFNRD
jgi:hypothetical protein